MSHEYVSGVPHPALRRHVHGYTGYTESGPAVARLEPPPGRIELIVSFGPHIDVIEPSGRRERHRSFAVGLAEEHSFTEHDGEQAGVQIGISPPAARALLGVPLGAIAHRVVALDELLGRSGDELAERLAMASGWDERFRLLDAAIARRLAAGTPPPREVSWAWERLAASGGATRVDALARETGWSRRHLAERFRSEIGLSPKVAARVLRFQRVTARLRAGRPDRLAELALDCGYYDQAHLNRDFRAFAGCTPTEYVSGFPFVQDGAAAVA
jgi:AraC-like DNA-binding protein